jgi:hypothetical protein
MDRVKRDALLRRVGDVNAKTEGLVLVTLEEFFDGNDDGGSIWCNLSAAPTPEKVFQILKKIRDRKDVGDVRILVTQYDGADDEWPFSDTVYFITSGSTDDVMSWLGDEYAADEMWLEEFGRAQAIPLPRGMHIIAAWWD